MKLLGTLQKGDNSSNKNAEKIVGLLGETKISFPLQLQHMMTKFCVLENMKYGRTIDFGVSMGTQMQFPPFCSKVILLLNCKVPNERLG